MSVIEYSAPQSRTGGRRWMLPPQAGPVIGLAIVSLLFSALRFKTFATVNNLQIMLTLTAVVGTAALGMTLIIISGGIDLSVGSNVALTCVTVAVLLNNHVPPVLAALGGVAVGCLMGLMIGLCITYLRLAPFIVTLGTWSILRGFAIGTAHEQPVDPDPTWLNNLLTLPGGSQKWMLVPAGVWMLLVLAAVVAGVLRYTRFGRHVFAIGSSEQTARLCGVNVARTKVLVYVVGGLFAGLAGVLQFSFLSSGDPTTADGMELNVIAAVVIGGASLSGGQGTIVGSLVGALLMTAVANGCNKIGMHNWVQAIVTGAIIILAAAIDRLRQSSR
ncbi:MAG TPA: ABC transporter permease [Tepidisphaeraceae bacterium]|jgi:ribose/xylose/arabinose/galactoside ABC-type transport system permease subunit|nr:ABC transporter permease [Tepidisphaeraceae bacterium]